MSRVVNPTAVAETFRQQLRDELAQLGEPVTLVGLLATDYGPSATYANYTRLGCEGVGIHFDLRSVEKYTLEDAIERANQDGSVHGVIIYYPVFSLEQDNYIKDQVEPTKDIEGLHTRWLRKLYHNDRIDDRGRKSILPCTPLAIIKLLESAGTFSDSGPPLAGRTVAIFNRSEVVGRPLAHMMANDGAHVFSFDVDGLVEIDGDGIRESSCSRGDALKQADIIVTGVPSREFELIRDDEIGGETLCVNFSTFKNFTPAAADKAAVFIPRVGPMTVTMALRNTLRLCRNYHHRT